MSARKVKNVSFTPDQVPYFFAEGGGLLEADQNEETYQITQKEIVKNVDITSATKHFDLNLPELGPYKVDYFRNGRSLLLGGRNGHVAMFDWLTKDLKCEFNVQESVHAVQWLHMPTMYAVGQANWTYVYDENGTEIHCLKRFYQVYELDFLPYHFLLVGASENGYLSWLDISTGKLVANFRMSKSPRLTSLTHNPANAISITGHPNGTVRMWSPNVKEPLVSVLCHPSAIRDIAVDKRGQVMITTGADRSIRIWDIRNYRCLQNFKLKTIPAKLDMSQRNLLAISSGNAVEVYKIFADQIDKPYMRHRLDERSSIISSVQFCPYEDVLGVGHSGGFTSLIIPGAGEPNFDALEANPYMNKSQRREMEVKSLLEKVDHEMITLDADFLAKVANKMRAPNKHREVMRAAEKRSKRPKLKPVKTDLIEEDDQIPKTGSDDEGQAESRHIVKRDPAQFQAKRGKKKLAHKLRSKEAKKEELRRNTLKSKAMEKRKSKKN